MPGRPQFRDHVVPRPRSEPRACRQYVFSHGGTVGGESDNRRPEPSAGPGPQLDTVQIDTTHGGELIDVTAELEVYRLVLDRMQEVALSTKQSRDLIHSISSRRTGLFACVRAISPIPSWPPLRRHSVGSYEP
ncbi:Scr1 family TA system antitoxin-like transcriptional regulator [Streptomyces sp. F63]|uniref:Scr1 family TA system antitoxin-like transcriptional regulator n=1 Tax=Streptomyces sp. F63 TaxID=2824887 RepID=UPI0035B4D452